VSIEGENMQQPPPQQGQWNQGLYTPYPSQQQYTQYPPQHGQWQQPPPNLQWQQPYGQPPPQQPKKKNKLLFIIGVIIVLVFFACAGASVLAYYGDNQNAATTTDTSNSSSTTSSTSSNFFSNSTSAPVVGKVGDTITEDSIACTLLSVKSLAGDEYDQPKPGNEFIVVDVKIKNNGSQQISYSPAQFHAKSGSGNVTSIEFDTPTTYTANNELNLGQLDPSGSVEGDIILQVPVGDHKAELTWQPHDFENTTQNAWNLGL